MDNASCCASNIRFPGQYHDRKKDLLYNMYRYYRPDVGRYMTPDPIGIAGGLNLYSYVGQNPIRYDDPEGLDFSGNLMFFWDWVFERGDAVRRYGPQSMEVQEIMGSPAGAFMRRTLVERGCLNVMDFSYGTLRAYAETSWRVNNTAAQVGGFLFDAVNNGDGTVTYTIRNRAGRHSFFYHLPFAHDVERGTGRFVIHLPPSTPIWVPSLGGTIEQVFTAKEPLPCECIQD